METLQIIGVGSENKYVFFGNNITGTYSSCKPTLACDTNDFDVIIINYIYLAERLADHVGARRYFCFCQVNTHRCGTAIFVVSQTSTWDQSPANQTDESEADDCNRQTDRGKIKHAKWLSGMFRPDTRDNNVRWCTNQSHHPTQKTAEGQGHQYQCR